VTDVELSPLEIATGLVFGEAPDSEREPAGPRERPLEALEAIILPALRQPPCLVSFSGGRDSSVVLAVATALARREGLPMPVAGTNRFADAPRAEESEWQELVVRHLGLADWQRFDLSDELDPVGPLAVRGLRRHGLLWPCNVHFHVPLFEAAAGGSVLTGVGGDEVFGAARWTYANEVLARRLRARPRDVLPVLLALSPTPLRRAVLRRRSRVSYPWLRPAAQRSLTRRLNEQEAEEPLRYSTRLRWWRRRRSVVLSLRNLALLAGEVDVTVVNPFATPRFADALAGVAPRGGPANRARFMRGLFGDLLPDAVYERRTKAVFDEAFWGRHSQALAERWDGEAADPDVVDAQALRLEWTRPVPDPHTFTLLQAAWLELNRRELPASPR
jgi:asparagine synthase (glutamine-hydrolysing)